MSWLKEETRVLWKRISEFGGMIALLFQAYLWPDWSILDYILVAQLLVAAILAVLWMTFCKKDAIVHIENKVKIGLPLSLLFRIAEPLSRTMRRLLNSGQIDI